ncbi:MAG: hypothetical protein KY475_18350, partial [Planctomycetes bacterium]|nr:hypothetical protein [Planctomycetota bacterium]
MAPARKRDSQSPAVAGMIEGAKVVLGGAAGLAIAVIALWWGWGRDPLGIFGGEAAKAKTASAVADVESQEAESQEPDADDAPPPAEVTESDVRSADAGSSDAPTPPAQEQAPPETPAESPLKPFAGSVAVAATNSASNPGVSESASLATQDTKLPPPDAEVREKKLATIREIFRSDFDRADSPEQQAKLAENLHEHAKQLDEDPDAQFVILRQAYELAVQAGRLDLAERYVEAMDERFAIDLDLVRRHMVAALADHMRSTVDRRRLAETAVRYVRDAMQRRQYDVAVG